MDPLSRIRVWLLAVLVLGMCGTIAELLLLGHYEDALQFVPLVLILLAFAVVVWHLIRPNPRTVLMLQIIMTLFLFAGAAGVAFHFQGAAGFQRDIDPSQPPWELLKKVMRAQTPPVLVPGMMIQLGLLGLIYTYRHPALQSMESNMTIKDRRFIGLIGVLIVAAVIAGTVRAQVGKGLLDLNVVSEKELLSLPHMTPAVVKGILDRRPFMNITELNAVLLGQKLTQEQAHELYRKAFIHVNLNTGTREEIMLIPGAGARMAREFDEYRPWRNWAQFDKEISKYVGQPETDRLKQYVFIPVNLNTASDDDILSIPGAGQRMVREFKEYRPWKTQAQFEKEIGKYVGAKEVARLWRYVVIQ